MHTRNLLIRLRGALSPLLCSQCKCAVNMKLKHLCNVVLMKYHESQANWRDVHKKGTPQYHSQPVFLILQAHRENQGPQAWIRSYE